MIIENSAVVRGLISRWVDEEPGFEVVAQCLNGKLAVEKISKANPDMLIIDIEMPVRTC